LRLTELLKRAGLAQPLMQDPVISGISADSRQIENGFLFAALSGSAADGSQYIAQAAVQGAVAICAPAHVPVPNGLAHIKSDNPRLALAQLASQFYGPLTLQAVAVTGTNGKTSTVNFAQQLWEAAQINGAALGTLGIRGPQALGLDEDGAMTTPDPVTLARTLARLQQAGISHVALEASSHGLHQYRLDGVALAAAGFTYIGRDHLDYHGTIEDYLAAKTELFSRVLPAGGTAVLNADIPEFTHLAKLCHDRGHKVLSYGVHGQELRLLKATPRPDGLELELNILGQPCRVLLAVTGTFQSGNILCALGLCLGSGLPVSQALDALPALRNVRGRMERVTPAPPGTGIYVDYAHTPDALETVIRALRPHTENRLLVVFGCGGNRDKGKRPVMGKIAAELADLVFVTDDNPRHEDPATIRAEIMAGINISASDSAATMAATVHDVADRAKAIQTAMKQLKPGDTLLIAGKGHEQGQIVGHEVRPFDDADIVRQIMAGQLLIGDDVE